jgi:hypothetical protein
VSAGQELAAAFHREVVGPLLARGLPGLRYAAARLGSGSDVLGLDDGRSRDHDWGLRLTLLVDGADHAVVPTADRLLARSLPESFAGHPVRFATTWDPVVSHRVEVSTVGAFAASRLGVDPLPGLSTVDWLTLTGQGVLEVAAGPVFADTTTELARLHQRLAWYPPEVERYALACAWHRISQRLPRIGRTADTGQPMQSRLLSATLVNDVVSLAFLLHRRWSPYDKWREALFATLPVAVELAVPLRAAVTADGWAEREAGLAVAVEVLARVQRERGLPTPERVVQPFWDRPYRTVNDELAGLLRAGLTDPVLSRLPLAGTVEQWVESIDVLNHADRRASLGAVYRTWAGAP